MYFRFFIVISPCKRVGPFICTNKLESPSPKDALCQVWLKLAQWFWRRRFFNFVNVFSLFRNYLPLEMGGALHLNKLESPSLKEALCQILLKLAQWFWRRRFLICQYILSISQLSPLGKGRGPSFEQTWILFTPGCLCAKFGWNWPRGSGGEDFKFRHLFSLFRNYLPLEKGGVLHWNKLESPSPFDALRHV